VHLPDRSQYPRRRIKYHHSYVPKLVTQWCFPDRYVVIELPSEPPILRKTILETTTYQYSFNVALLDYSLECQTLDVLNKNYFNLSIVTIFLSYH
jgi:hypothetical protein